jgi:hypothetical protein
MLEQALRLHNFPFDNISDMNPQEVEALFNFIKSTFNVLKRKPENRKVSRQLLMNQAVGIVINITQHEKV